LKIFAVRRIKWDMAQKAVSRLERSVPHSGDPFQDRPSGVEVTYDEGSMTLEEAVAYALEEN
jgi:hypothetical protein